MTGLTLDAGGLIAVDRDDRRLQALLERAKQRGIRVTVPATALAQAMRSPAKQAQLSRLIRHPGTDVLALDEAMATAAGILLARTGTSDIVDAHVVICARRAGQAVVTSDVQDLRRLAPELELVSV